MLSSVLLSAQKGEIHTFISANWAVLLIKWPAARPFAFLTQRHWFRGGDNPATVAGIRYAASVAKHPSWPAAKIAR